MAIIGTITKQENGSYTGMLSTITVKAKITFTPVEKTKEKAPDFRVSAGNAEIGAAWNMVSKDKKEYISAKLDDPSFSAPIYCRVVEAQDGHALVWSRNEAK